MVELVRFLIGQLVSDPECVEISAEETSSTVEITVTLPQSEMGKVIGKQGRIAKAVRTIVKAASAKENKKYNIEITEKA